ncbi:hypothetical protein [Isoptericola sp. QY 916]|uniref:YobI family P-loop NTPase n=1 Tax=Isoptericola sp. QY 916 TaxID=2782570 RepID=UPI003D2FFA3E|nr:hypothetical protein [Isoptericola sp. QY 916]
MSPVPPGSPDRKYAHASPDTASGANARRVAANPIAKGDESPGGRMAYSNLAAAFDPDNHQIYHDLLVRSINTDGVRNVALTGAYGTGKSSILAQLRRDRGKKLVQLSLSTIAPPERHNDGGSATPPPNDPEQTNLIQKEIVKQLLYLRRPEETPRSRFRRATVPNHFREWFIAGLTGATTVALLLLMGILQPMAAEHVPEPEWRWWTSYALLAGLIATVVWAARRAISNRLAVSASVKAGLTTVTLSDSSDSYFDEYLDEIVYFFQASEVNVVVIEDIDRFKDIQVFDTLRALNGLLNGAGSLKRVVFVYAIRDSVFELIGATPESGASIDATEKAIGLASRTKFFDVIIPVVPFLTADNARDLMSAVMEGDNFEIDQGLIRTAARHAADMRLIHNIRNEFEVYRNQLVLPTRRLFGITNDLVFAMVLYKNTHLEDFERIRHQTSSLDSLYQCWRDLVSQNLAAEIDRLSKLRSQLELDELADRRAIDLGEATLAWRKALETGIEAGGAGRGPLTIGGAAGEDTIRDRATWASIAAGEPLSMTYANRHGYGSTMVFSTKELEAILGTRIDADEWAAVDRSSVETEIAECQQRIHDLRHHTWHELCTRQEFTLEMPAEPNDSGNPSVDEPTKTSPTISSPKRVENDERQRQELTFDQLVEAKLISPLAKDLVRKGYVTEHFALYTSTYYGTHLGPEALEYVRRCIEPGQPDALYQLSPQSVEQILIEQGAAKNDNADIFEDRSILNVSIVDYLLKARPGAAQKIAMMLAAWGDLESQFVDIYCSEGAHPELLISAMAPKWKAAVRYAAIDAPLPAGRRTAVLDAVLGEVPTADGYTVDDEVRAVFESEYEHLNAVTRPEAMDRAKIVLGIVAASGATIARVKPLNEHAREMVIENGAFFVNAENLRELVGRASIALDTLIEADTRVSDHAMRYLDDYMTIFEDSHSDEMTVEEPENFLDVVNRVAEAAQPRVVGEVIARACPFEVQDIGGLSERTWPFMVAGERVRPTFGNVHKYIGEFGIDAHLATFLYSHRTLAWEDAQAAIESRRAVAIAILNARDVIPDVDARVTHAQWLKPGELGADTIVPESSSLSGALIAGGLLADDAVTFSSALMLDWNSREAAIAASSAYATFIAPETLPPSQIPALMRSSKVGADIKKAVVESIEALLVGASRAEANAVARALNEFGWSIRAARIRALIDKGVRTDEIVQLIAREVDIEVDTLRGLLRQMGDSYARIADIGKGSVQLPDDPNHSFVIGKLMGITVSSISEKRPAPGYIRANLRQIEP